MTISQIEYKKLLHEPTFVRFNGSKYVKGKGRLVGEWKEELVYVYDS